MNKIFLAAAALGCLTGGGVLAEDAMTGTVKPFGSVLSGIGLDFTPVWYPAKIGR